MPQFILIRRSYEAKQVLGNLLIMEGTDVLFSCKTLELPWLGNQKRISCIPAGSYPLVWEYSGKFKKNLWELKSVPNRDEIKFHVANFNVQLNGCIGVGYDHLDLNNDGVRDLNRSAYTLNKIHQFTENVVESTLWVYGDGRDKL